MTYQKLIFLSALLVTWGCGSATPSLPSKPMPTDQNGAKGKKNDDEPLWRYRITDGCDSYERVFKTEDEFCQSMQVDENNHDCTQGQREKKFKDLCPGGVWNPTEAREELLYGQGNLLHCTFTESSHKTFNYALDQYSRAGYIYLSQDHYFAVVDEIESDTGVKLNLNLYDLKKNKVIETAETSSGKSDKNFYFGKEAEKLDFTPRVYCTVHKGPLR